MASKASKSNKLQEIDSDPFKLGGGAAAQSNSSSMNFGGEIGISEKEARDRL